MRWHTSPSLEKATGGRQSLQRPKLESLELADAFDVVVFGGHDAEPTPDPEPFHLALDRLGTEPGRTVHVGDELSSEVAGAHAAGTRSMWVTEDGMADALETHDPTPDYTVGSLRELIPPPW